MTPVYPLELNILADTLTIAAVVFDIQRNDEFSGVGSSNFWQAELAAPLWTAEVSLSVGRINQLKQSAAKLRALNGSNRGFMLYDPQSKYPQYDPDGSILGSNNITIQNVGGDRTSLSIGGLPANYVLTVGDKIQIPFGSNPVRHGFYEISETNQASGSGIVSVSIFPSAHVGVTAGLSVILKKPACHMVLFPDSHKPGRAQQTIVEEAGFKALQKLRAAS